MLRILVTDGDNKHSIAIGRFLKNDIHDIYLIAHTRKRSLFARFYKCFDSLIEGVPLQEALTTAKIDMVIPVGGESVLIVNAQARDKAVLPPPPSLGICYDKFRTVRFAEELGVPVPRTVLLNCLEDVETVSMTFPCVVKPACEVDNKFVFYADKRDDLAKAIKAAFSMLGDIPRGGVLVQERVPGIGSGFFCLYDLGLIKRVFMHRRIREWPLTGGASTAARAIDDPRLESLGRQLMDGLHWHGVAMVEFKYDTVQDRYVLMEINGKFWGSAELSLTAGVNFAAGLVRIFRGEKLDFEKNYNTSIEFYWPLDDDLLALAKSRQLRRVREYFSPNARTNLFQSPIADLLKVAAFTRRVVLSARRPS
jgi:predicted ATP-grasp superfamily ATP-dependent carboligase